MQTIMSWPKGFIQGASVLVILRMGFQAVLEMIDISLFSIGRAWVSNKITFILILIFEISIPISLLLTGGAQALLINHLRVVLSVGQVDRFLIILLMASIILVFLRGISLMFCAYLQRLLFCDVNLLQEVELSSKLVELDIATHEDPLFKDELQVLQESGMSSVTSVYLSIVLSNLQSIVGLSSSLVVVGIVQWQLACVMVLSGLPTFFVELKYGGELWRVLNVKSQDRRHYQEAKRHIQTTNSLYELHSHKNSGFFIARMSYFLEKFNNQQKEADRRRTTSRIIAQLVACIGISVATVTLILKLIHGDIQLGTFVFLQGVTINLQVAASSFFIGISELRKNSRPVTRLKGILKRARIINKPLVAKSGLFDRAPVIEFRDISFAYPANPEKFVLKNFSLVIDSGERLAILGINGAGKSTIIKLICRFYDPTSGQILINGVDLREVDLDKWYESIAILSQEFASFKLMAWEIIHLGRINSQVDHSKIALAAKSADAEGFIAAWPKEYEQQVGVEFDGGIDPSGGQRQKLAVSRSLYREGWLTILDEPTSNVDPSGEEAFIKALYDKGDSKRTIVVISHRLSVIRGADRICIVRNGAVCEIGSHDYLMEIGGEYSNLYKMQAKYYR